MPPMKFFIPIGSPKVLTEHFGDSILNYLRTFRGQYIELSTLPLARLKVLFELRRGPSLHGRSHPPLSLSRYECWADEHSSQLSTLSPNYFAWKNALARAGIENFRWRDLRHTWASWHAQSGTSLQELMELGGWSSFEMVLGYAHLAADHLKEAVCRIENTNPAHRPQFETTQKVVSL